LENDASSSYKCVSLITDKFKSPERPISKPFRLSVNDIFKGTGSGFCVSGRVETGLVQVGDKVLVQPQNEGAVIKGKYCIKMTEVVQLEAGWNWFKL
jgi:translation elongation factor EF-1alpha